MHKVRDLHNEIKDCQACRLCESRTNVVPGEGPSVTSVMMIGEAPGREENSQGRPFVGRSGKLLTQLMKDAGIPRHRVFITNLVKCRPISNRDPLGDEVDECRKILKKQIKIIKPRLIVLVGAVPTKWIIGEGPITRVRGKPFVRKDKVYYFPVFHPAYALRNHTARQQLLKDLRKAVRLERELAFKRGQDILPQRGLHV